jgi:hypothetical protein
LLSTRKQPISRINSALLTVFLFKQQQQKRRKYTPRI